MAVVGDSVTAAKVVEVVGLDVERDVWPVAWCSVAVMVGVEERNDFGGCVGVTHTVGPVVASTVECARGLECGFGAPG